MSVMTSHIECDYTDVKYEEDPLSFTAVKTELQVS